MMRRRSKIMTNSNVFWTTIRQFISSTGWRKWGIHKRGKDAALFSQTVSAEKVDVKRSGFKTDYSLRKFSLTRNQTKY